MERKRDASRRPNLLHAACLVCLTVAPIVAQSAANVASRPSPPKHFDHVIVVVLENQNYDSAINDDLLKKLATKGVVFSNFVNLYHPSYPNYLAMISGSSFGTQKHLDGDRQVDLPADEQHRTIGDLINWRNYAEDYPASPTDNKPFLGAREGRYARKHVPFLSFKAVQEGSFRNVVQVDTHRTDNAFVTDIGGFIADAKAHPLPEYIFYSPNLDDDGHDPIFNAPVGMKKASAWLSEFLTKWLHFDENAWVPKDENLSRTLVVITFDEAEGRKKPERLYTVFLGAMVKPQEVTARFNHLSVLRTIEDNFGLNPLQPDGDGAASVIAGIWK